MGTSAPSISMMQLSTPHPAAAAEDVLDGADRHRAPLEGGGVVEGGRRVEPRGDGLLGVVAPDEHQAVVGRRGPKGGANRMTGVEADAVDGDCRSECRLLPHASSTCADASQ
jgi:hypothetical protein